MHDIHDVARAVARHLLAYPYKLWGFGEGIGLESLIEAGVRLGRPDYLGFVAGLMARWDAERAALPPTDHVAPGTSLVMLYRHTGDARLLRRAHELAELLESMPRSRGGAQLHRYDDRRYHANVYVDCMDFDAPFLSLLARETGEPGYYDQAVECWLGHHRVLWDSRRHLYYHLYDAEHDSVNGAFWGRGNGWAALGTVGLLENLPRSHGSYEQVATRFREHIGALAALQSADGAWHTVLDRPDTYVEGSLQPMFYCALARGLGLGVLPAGYGDTALRAVSAFRRHLRADGLLTHVSEATPPGSAEHYAGIRSGGNFPWGQGPALGALLLEPPD